MPRAFSSSHRQQQANRQNSAKSTGRRTQEGKARSRSNALKHGLTAETILLPGEELADVEQISESLTLYYQPSTTWEEQLIGQAASLMLRLKRVPSFEGALFHWVEQQDRMKDRGSPVFCEMELLDFSEADAASTAELNDRVVESDTEPQMGRTFAALLDQNLLSKLTRYETSLHGRLSSTLRKLDDFRARRLREERED